MNICNDGFMCRGETSCNNRCRHCGGCGCNICCCQGPQGPQGVPGAQGPQGATGPAGPAAISAYGGLYNAGTQLLFFTAINIYLRLRLNSILPFEDVVPDAANYTLTIQETGDYEVNYNILMSANHTVNVNSAVRRNGSILVPTQGAHTLSFNTTTDLDDDARLSASTIVSLQAGDVLDLAVAVINTLPTGLDVAVNGYANATLTVKLLKAA